MQNVKNDPSQRLLDCLLTAMDSIDRAALGMIELRPRAKARENVTSGDYDFVIKPEDLPHILRLCLNACLTHGVHLELNNTALNKRVLRFASGGKRVVMELWQKIEMVDRKGAEYRLELSGTEIVTALQGASDEEAQVLKAAIYLTHLHFKRKDIDQPLQQTRLQQFHTALAGSSRPDSAALARAFEKLLAGSKSGPQPELAAANLTALKWLADQGFNVHPRRFATLRKRWHRDRRLIGPILPVLGPDGAGKTYFCDHLVAEEPEQRQHMRYKKFFRNYDYRLLMRVMRLIFPQDKENQLDERLSVYVILKAGLVSFLRGKQLQRQDRLLLIDRYGWDYLLKGIRRRHNSPARIALHGLWRRLIPRPSKCIILFGHAETIHARKPDLSTEMIDFVYDEYIELVAAGRALRCFFCNTELDYDAVRRDLNAFLDKV